MPTKAWRLPVASVSALEGEPRTATALAVDDVEAVVAPARLLSAVLESDAELAGELLRVLAARLRESDRQRRESSPCSTAWGAWRGGCSREATVKALRTLREVADITTGRRAITLRDPELLRRHARLA